MRGMQAGLAIVLMATLSACGSDGLRLLSKPGEGPDEFLIVPGKPLQQPDDLAALPTPTPGGVNLTDQDPVGDATAALGGRRASGGGIPASDGALVNQASRFGRDASVRAQLTTEDEAFRRRQGRFSRIRIVKEDRYAQIYRRQSLDAQSEAERWRRAGARTPSAPPN